MKVIYNKREREILDGCIRGDRIFQEQLYKRFAKKMFGVCLGYVKNIDDANDLLQEGFIKVFQNICKCSGTGSLEGWVRKVIVNHNIDRYRRLEGKDIFEELTEVHLNACSQPIANAAYQTLDKGDFWVIINSLPNGYRMVLNLYLVEDYTHKEIAQYMGISEGTSKSQLSKAKRCLRKTLSKFIDKGLLESYEKYERRKLERVV